MGKNELTISKVMIKILRLFITTIAALIAVLLLINFIPFIKRSSFNIGLTLAVLICIFFFDKEKLHDFGLKISKESLSLFIKGLAYALISFLISLIAVYFYCLFFEGTKLDILPNRSNISSLSLLSFYVLVAFSEELYFRGYILSNIKRAGSNIPAVIISSFFFMIMHLVNPQASLTMLSGTFVISIYLSVLYLKTNSLWSCIGFHFAWNYLQDSVMLTPTEGPEWIAVAVFTLILFYLCFYYKFLKSVNRKQGNSPEESATN
ncbi:MAG TPA: type II CAAX endopeptidase family protein [Defluviitaleaceae bacterium]|nr:type II CAAX endopeptidase family protein [Defluviitaleaceae bacterium]